RQVDRHRPAMTGVVLLLEQRLAALALAVGVAAVGDVVEPALGQLGVPGRIVVELAQRRLADQLGEALLEAARVDVGALARDVVVAAQAGADVPVLLDVGQLVALAGRRDRHLGRVVPARRGADLVRVPADRARGVAADAARRGAPAAEHEADRALGLTGDRVAG